ncbi:HEPN domain-containing protein [Rubrivirga sp.]|uniref:HEPN domain-containing protein n=1 Tax=Rubrivirga sp. TaxID=1885344 RepID=UPI003B5214B7
MRHVESDLQIAETAPPSGVLLEHLCFHAQQAAEKAIKMVLIAHDVVPPKTHNIASLFGLVSESVGTLPEGLLAASSLTAYAVLTRYPADFGELDEDEWTASVERARAVVVWAREIVADQL